jgi:two-component system, sensor histidine kinase RegB
MKPITTYSLTVVGILFGFALNAVLLVVFATRINRNLRDATHI